MVELLALHDYATLNSAINAGADAVYFGVGSLNMRANASGFSPKDLKKYPIFAIQKSMRISRLIQ